MFVTVAALVSVIATLTVGSVSGQDCTLNLQTQTNPLLEPLILEVGQTRDGRPSPHLIRPNVIQVDEKTFQGVIPVPDGKELLIACMGKKNFVEISKKDSDYVKCSSGKLTIQDKEANEDTLACSKGVADSWIEKTDQVCGEGENKGTKFELGFKLNDDTEKALFALVDVCHNIEKMETYYTHHELYGKSLKGAVQSSLRRKFSPGPKSMDLFHGINPDKAYSKGSQLEAIDAILGKGQGIMYVNEKTSMSRGHLSPDADFIFNTGQQMTYYFVNVAPQWQSFNAGNWLTVENTVRSLAVKEQATLKVWTGTYGVLQLKGSKGVEKKIYLDPEESRVPKQPRKSKNWNPNEDDKGNHLPVPEVYWKLVQHPTDAKCIVAVGHNDVHLKTKPTTICNEQSKNGWQILPKLEQGYTYYCDYQSFRNTVTFAPNIECEKLFAYPK